MTLTRSRVCALASSIAMRGLVTGVVVTVALGGSCDQVANMRGPEPVARTAKVKGAAAPIGVNLTSIDDWSPSYPFTDVFKQSRAWFSATDAQFDDQRPLSLDQNGNVTKLLPGQYARTLLFPDAAPRFPKGKYTVLYEGKGTLDYHLTALGPSGIVQSPGRDVVDVDAARGQITVTITAIDAADPIRNIRMLAPAVCADRPHVTCDGACTCVDFAALPKPPLFHPAWLADHKGFGVLRFMDWQKTNNSTVQTEATRPKVSDARWSPKGAPYEIAVRAAEELDADPWINVPHLADDAYVTALATHLRDNVAKERRIYVELSNEVWNDMFTQSKWADAEGKRRNIGGKEHERRWRAYSERAVEVHAIFARVFGGVDRLVRVMGVHAANPWLAEIELSHKDAYKNVDAIALAPYMGGSYGYQQKAVSYAEKAPVELLADLEKLDVPEVAGWTSTHKKIADKFDVKLIAYEGGVHTVGVGPPMDNAALNTLFDATNRDAAMSSLIVKYLAAWKQNGGDVFVYFNDTEKMTKFGRWGLREYTGQPRSEAPKLDGVWKFMESTPRWWP